MNVQKCVSDGVEVVRRRRWMTTRRGGASCDHDRVQYISLPRLAGAVIGLVLIASGITMMFLGMRAVMDIGGYCASGGAYVIESECPNGTGPVVILGLVGGLIGAGIYKISSVSLPGTNLLLLAWSALFLALGWNFWEYGITAGLDVGWIICGVLFVLIAAMPLFSRWSPRRPGP